MTHLSSPPLLMLEGLSKVFPNGIAALRGVDLALHSATVHGLLGANGAGKSTLIKILSGASPATAGKVLWQGERVLWTRPAQPRAAGIATLHQHIPLVGTLSVLENVFLGERAGWRRTARLRVRLNGLLESLGYPMDVDATVSELSIGQRQMVGILQALAAEPRLVVMDEPTASLAAAEREIVYDTIRKLRATGTAVMLVSHFLDEILALTDEVTVLRDGRAVLHGQTAELSETKIAAAIVGTEIAALTGKVERAPFAAGHGEPSLGEPLLDVVGMRSPGRLSECSLQLRNGEILGIAGFLGAGRSELLHAIFGADPQARGEVRLGGRIVERSPRAAVESGMALVPEDRLGQGLIPAMSLWRNVSLACVGSLKRAGGVVDHSRELELAEAAISRLGIKAASVEVPVAELSGGNAQKVSIAKWLSGGTRVYLLDEPTAGVDVGARIEILQALRDLASAGAGVIIVSSDFEELLAVADRILVLRQGRVVAERRAEATSEQELVLLAGGTAALGPSGSDMSGIAAALDDMSPPKAVPPPFCGEGSGPAVSGSGSLT